MTPGSKTSLALALLLALAAFIGGAITGVAGRLACDENIRPGTTRESVCRAAGTDSSLALFALVPSVVMFLVALTGSRRVAGVSATVILAAQAILLVVVLKTAT
jgi:hypothetical protein